MSSRFTIALPLPLVLLVLLLSITSSLSLSTSYSSSSSKSSSSSSPSSSSSRSVVSAAIHILEDASTRNIPVDGALRRYAKQQQQQNNDRSYVNSQEYKALGDIIRGIAVRQERIDWRLNDAGVDCTPTNRLKFLLQSKGKVNQLECKEMDLQTRLECPDWAWPGLQDAFPGEENVSTEKRWSEILWEPYLTTTPTTLPQ